ncbi:hypothetical protein [Branchiibius cervicis]|uniref:Uncharacterized protein n=1 Tax=Branchiibius cervicis TaxID=908252 RepID=A0ABW2AS00_9MICO
MTDDTLHLNGTLGSTKRSGLWQVPRYVSIKRRLGSVELDFSQAEFVDDTVDILVDLVGGSLEIRCRLTCGWKAVSPPTSAATRTIARAIPTTPGS